MKYRVKVGKVYGEEERDLDCFSYLGDGKAVIQTNLGAPYQEYDAVEYKRELGLVDLEKGELIRRYAGVGKLLGAGQQGYFYVLEGNMVVKVNSETGHYEKRYSLANLYATGEEYEAQELNEGIFYRDMALTFTVCDGILYVKHVSGIFKLDEENKAWVHIVNGKKYETVSSFV